MEEVITFRHKSGYECAHSPNVTTEDEWWRFIKEIMLEMNRSTPGILITNGSYAIHRVSEIEAIHFGDIEPPEDNTSIPRLGFVKE